MPNENTGKDLEIIDGHLCVRLLMHGVICIAKCQDLLKLFLLAFSSFSSSQHLVNNCSTIPKNLTIRFQ